MTRRMMSMSPIDMIYLPLQHLNLTLASSHSDYEDPCRRLPLLLLEGGNALAGIDRGKWSSAGPSQPSVRPSKLSGVVAIRSSCRRNALCLTLRLPWWRALRHRDGSV